MKKVVIVSLVTALMLTACTTETATEEVAVPTAELVVEIVETIEVTEPVVEVTRPVVEEPVVELKPMVEIPPLNLTPMVEIKPVEPIVEPTVEVKEEVKEEVKVEVKVEEVTEPVEVTEPTETVEPESTYLGNFKLTAYCACAKCCGKSDGITATGTVATQGRTIAVDPSVISYGTAVSINGNTYVAEDCGGNIGGNRIDVFFNNHTDALNFGVQYADVYLV